MACIGLAAAVIAAALAATPAAAPSGGPARLGDNPPNSPIFTRQTLFSIPFRIDTSDPASRDIAEIQLYVSTNRGASWRLYERAEPQRRSFPFRAGGDGEYWFSLRTIDRAGQVRPQNASGPGLRVIVDTMPPQMSLEARSGDGGQVSARWQITEPHLNPESLQIQFRTGPSQPWQTVAVDRQRMSSSGPVQSGEVSWWPQGALERIEIRGEVADLAGNTAVSHAQVLAGASAASAALPGARPELNPPAPRAVPPLTSPQDVAGAEPRAARGEGPVAIQIHSASNSRSMPSGPERGSLLPGVPAGERPRMVNSLRLELRYDLEPAAGATGVPPVLGVHGQDARATQIVEIWGTRDGAQTWQRLGADQDRRGLFAVTVPGEGVYGFRLLLRDKAGHGAPPPSAGSPAELWVGVDLTKPNARIVSAQQLTGPQSGQLDIRWEADDRVLAPRPVSLAYGPSHDGPWTAIAAGLENTGRYVWWMDGRVPSRIYLRLEVRDEAGNVAAFVKPEPVAVDPQHPPLRIRDVRPL
jgi:hypothetical protein